MNNPILYSIDENLATRDHHEVSLENALAIVKRYMTEMRPSDETGEEALSSTMFGFFRSDKEFIEICMHSPSEISVKIELPVPGRHWLVRLWRGDFQHEETVHSLGAVNERVRQFFNVSPNELRSQLS